MKVEELTPFPPGENPFNHDYTSMGIYVGKNACVMHRKHFHDDQPWIIVVDMTTGKRVRISFEDADGNTLSDRP